MWWFVLQLHNIDTAPKLDIIIIISFFFYSGASCTCCLGNRFYDSHVHTGVVVLHISVSHLQKKNNSINDLEFCDSELSRHYHII